MRRANLVVLVVLLALVVAGMSVQADTVATAFGIPVVTVTKTTVVSSATPMITFSDKSGGKVNGWVIGPTFTAPISSYTITNETLSMGVDLKVFGVDANHLKGTQLEVEGLDGLSIIAENNTLWVNLQQLGPGRYLLISRVSHNQSRRDWKILFFIGEVEHVLSKDETAIAFNVQNVDDDIRSFLSGQCGVSNEQELSDTLWPVYRSRVYSMFATCLMLAYKQADYQEASSSAALRVQGFAPPLSPRQAQPDPALVEYQQQVVNLTEELQKLREQLMAPKPEVAPTTPPTLVDPPVVKTTKELLMEKYFGRTGCVFYTETPGATMSWWLKSTSGAWVRVKVTNPVTREVTDNLTIGPGKERCWFYDSAKLTGDGWTGFGLGTGDAEPTTMLPIDSNLYILGVK